MNARQKRSNGGYGLRRKVAKKRLDEDFEYYFSKIGTPVDSSIPKCMKEEDDAKVHTQLMMVTELVKASPEKRPRGRPKKIQVTIPDREPDISESNLKFVDLKEKRSRKAKIIYIDENETSKAVHEICGKEEEVVAVAHEEIVEDEGCIVKHLKLEAVLADEITGLQEEEVSSLPEGEKENLPEEGVGLDYDTEERMAVQIAMDAQGDSGEGEGDGYEDEGDESEKMLNLKGKRKYKRGRVNQDAFRKFSQLNPEDKIECNECHKLLKPSSFRQHLRTHTGEKPFGCEVCAARFTRKGDVERHVRIVHNKQKPFKCCRCQRAFGDKKNLRWHLMNHDKKLFYVCEVCGFKFGKREYWENHVRFIHPLQGSFESMDNGADGEGEREDRLQALTDSLLGEEESVVDDPNQNNTAFVRSIQQKESLLSNCLSTDIVETVPVISQISKQDSYKTVDLKGLNITSLIKIARPRGSEGMESSRYVVHNETEGIDAVVIHFNDSGIGSSTLQHVPAKERQNVIRVVAPHEMLQLVHEENPVEQEQIIINTQDYVEDYVEDSIGEGEQAVSPDGEESGAVVEYMEPEPSKVISIMLNQDEGAGGDVNSSSVQTLIEALLDAAKGDSQSADAPVSST